MPKSRSDGLYFLQGMTLTFAILGAIATLGAGLLVMLIAFAPSELAASLRQVGGRTLEGDAMLAGFIQTVGWFWLVRLRFVSRRFGKAMMLTMGILTIVMFLMVLLALF
jgi:hypothetical protein